MIPHGRNIYAKEYDMANATMCADPHSDRALPHWKCVLRCCVKCPSINLPDQETDDHYSNTSPSIRFHIYHIVAHCTTHGRIMLNDKKMCCKCKQDYVSEKPTKIYNRQKCVRIHTQIVCYHTGNVYCDVV